MSITSKENNYFVETDVKSNQFSCAISSVVCFKLGNINSFIQEKLKNVMTEIGDKDNSPGCKVYLVDNVNPVNFPRHLDGLNYAFFSATRTKIVTFEDKFGFIIETAVVPSYGDKCLDEKQNFITYLKTTKEIESKEYLKRGFDEFHEKEVELIRSSQRSRYFSEEYINEIEKRRNEKYLKDNEKKIEKLKSEYELQKKQLDSIREEFQKSKKQDSSTTMEESIYALDPYPEEEFDNPLLTNEYPDGYLDEDFENESINDEEQDIRETDWGEMLNQVGPEETEIEAKKMKDSNPEFYDKVQNLIKLKKERDSIDYIKDATYIKGSRLLFVMNLRRDRKEDNHNQVDTLLKKLSEDNDNSYFNKILAEGIRKRMVSLSRPGVFNHSVDKFENSESFDPTASTTSFVINCLLSGSSESSTSSNKYIVFCVPGENGYSLKKMAIGTLRKPADVYDGRYGAGLSFIQMNIKESYSCDTQLEIARIIEKAVSNEIPESIISGSNREVFDNGVYSYSVPCGQSVVRFGNSDFSLALHDDYLMGFIRAVSKRLELYWQGEEYIGVLERQEKIGEKLSEEIDDYLNKLKLFKVRTKKVVTKLSENNISQLWFTKSGTEEMVDDYEIICNRLLEKSKTNRENKTNDLLNFLSALTICSTFWDVISMWKLESPPGWLMTILAMSFVVSVVGTFFPQKKSWMLVARKGLLIFGICMFIFVFMMMKFKFHFF